MTTQAGKVAALRARWNERAAQNPMFFINAEREDWTPEDFLRSGEEDVQRFAVPAFHLLGQPPGQSTALDIGCGLGRLTRALGRHFASVIGVDISQTMIEDGRTFCGGWPANVECRLCDGSGQLPIDSASIDFVFSYIVFQHIPAIGIIRTYFSEISRVMKEGAVGLVQVNTHRRPLSERLQIRIVSSDKVPVIHRKLKLRLDPPSTMGVVLSLRQCQSLCDDNGLDLVSLTGAHDQYTWLTVRKAT